MNLKKAIFAILCLSVVSVSAFYVLRAYQQSSQTRDSSIQQSFGKEHPPIRTGSEPVKGGFQHPFPGQRPATIRIKQTQKHQGPQTVEALLKSFGNMMKPDSEVDEKYPPAAWLEMLLNRGVTIANFGEYSGYMNIRRNLVRLETEPDKWTSDLFGIAPTSDWESFKSLYIDRKIWENQQYSQAKEANPRIVGGMFTGPDKEIFLPFVPGRVYLQQNGLAATLYGEVLDDAQKFNLLHKGIHPENYEVIYLDENYNPMSEPPVPITRERMLENVTLPPGDWVPPEGWTPPPGLEEALRAKGWTGTFFPQEDKVSPAPTTVESEIPREDDSPNSLLDYAPWMESADTPIERLKERQKDKPEQVREPALKSETDFEEQVTQGAQEHQELPTEESLETALREQFSPERLNRAMSTLNRYGWEEGLHRLRKADAEVAEQLERVLTRKRTTRDTRQ